MRYSGGLVLVSLRCQELMIHLDAGIWRQLRGSTQQLSGYSARDVIPILWTASHAPL